MCICKRCYVEFRSVILRCCIVSVCIVYRVSVRGREPVHARVKVALQQHVRKKSFAVMQNCCSSVNYFPSCQRPELPSQNGEQNHEKAQPLKMTYNEENQLSVRGKILFSTRSGNKKTKKKTTTAIFFFPSISYKPHTYFFYSLSKVPAKQSLNQKSER